MSDIVVVAPSEDLPQEPISSSMDSAQVIAICNDLIQQSEARTQSQISSLSEMMQATQSTTETILSRLDSMQSQTYQTQAEVAQVVELVEDVLEEPEVEDDLVVLTPEVEEERQDSAKDYNRRWTSRILGA